MGDELREARLMAGLSQASIGSAVAMSYTKVGRIERGVLPTLSLVTIAEVAAVLGHELSTKLYPDGPPLRDAAHLELLARFRSSLHVSLRMRTEVALPEAGDRRAWDGVVYGAGEPIAVEAETRLRDVQALERRITLKQRDGGIGRVILLVHSSRSNRETLREWTPGLLTAFPIPGSSVLRDLRSGRDPGGSGIVVL